MPLEPAAKILLQLAGTVALPAPPPGSASVEIIPPEEAEGEPAEIYLRLTQYLSLTVIVRWIIPVRHIAALAIRRGGLPPDSAAEPWPLGKGWEIRSAREVVRLVRAKVARERERRDHFIPWLDEAVIFVPEAASVLRIAEAGLTAAESISSIVEPTTRLEAEFPGGTSSHCDVKWPGPVKFREIHNGGWTCDPHDGKSGP